MKAINLKFGFESERVNGDVYTLTPLGQSVKDALKKVNGKSEAHTFICLDQLNEVVCDAEDKLESIGLAKKYRAGARYTAVSGGSVPSAYKYSRTATTITIERRSTGWFLVHANDLTIYKDSGKGLMSLTKAQDEQAIAALRKGYLVQA